MKFVHFDTDIEMLNWSWDEVLKSKFSTGLIEKIESDIWHSYFGEITRRNHSSIKTVSDCHTPSIFLAGNRFLLIHISIIPHPRRA